MNIGKNFKECRKNSNKTQKEVAEILKIHQSNISDWENDVSRPDYENLIELSKIYSVTIEELLGLE